MNKILKLCLFSLVTISGVNAQENDQSYWCKYTNSCNNTTQQNQPVPQEDPYSTGTYNDGGPVTEVNGAPYYDPYNTPGEEEIEMPMYGGEFVGYGNNEIRTINNYNGSGDFTVRGNTK